MFEQILDIPVIIQGAISSLFFWLCYTVFTRLGAFLSSIIGKFNKSWRYETLLFEQIQSQYMVATPDKRQEYLLLCIYGAISLAAQGLIYLCLGLVASYFIGSLALIAYCFSIIYFSRAMKAVFSQPSDSKDQEWYERRIKEISKEIEELGQ